MRQKPVVLCILDGWGYNPETRGNAIALARKPNWDRLTAEYPHTLIHTSGPYVGLPEGQMGNSEVGHMNMGAGRIIQMDITRIDMAIANGEFFQNPLLLDAMRRAREHQLHLIGLVSDGGVHSHITHLFALLRMAAEQKVSHVFIHAFMDGRDTPPESGASFLEALEAECKRLGVGRIATVSGRYYAMDRDKRWERTGLAYSAMTKGDGREAATAVGAMKASYEAGITDEFVEPAVIDRSGLIRPDDAVVFFNFRADRARQMTSLLSKDHIYTVTMTRYYKEQEAPYVQEPVCPANILAEVFASAGLRNMRIAETEKYAHVTYFFNGGTEKPFPGEERVMIPSPKVATYDLKPEMSAEGVADAVVKAAGDMDCLIVNFANADMVGHSGKVHAAIQAVEAVDACVGRVYEAVRRAGGALIVTADHGNAEMMIDPVTGGPHTYHTTNPVPLILASEAKPELRSGGSLRDLAPTIIGLMGLSQPADMTGTDLRK